MNDKDIDTWVKALRSGDYAQGQHQLCKTVSGRERHCCLGVMIDELVDCHWTHTHYGKDRGLDCVWTMNGCSGLPSARDRDAVGLQLHIAEELGFMNDAGKSFDEIADWIEENRSRVRGDEG